MGDDDTEDDERKGNVMHSINIVKEFPLIYHLEIKENSNRLMYDEAVDQLTKNCDGIPLN